MTSSFLQTSIPRLSYTISFTDTNPPHRGLACYRIGVQQQQLN